MKLYQGFFKSEIYRKEQIPQGEIKIILPENLYEEFKTKAKMTYTKNHKKFETIVYDVYSNKDSLILTLENNTSPKSITMQIAEENDELAIEMIYSMFQPFDMGTCFLRKTQKDPKMIDYEYIYIKNVYKGYLNYYFVDKDDKYIPVFYEAFLTAKQLLKEGKIVRVSAYKIKSFSTNSYKIDLQDDIKYFDL